MLSTPFARMSEHGYNSGKDFLLSCSFNGRQFEMRMENGVISHMLGSCKTQG